MSDQVKPFCPECVEPEAIDRRGFIRVVGEGTAALVTLAAAARGVRAADTASAKKAEKPAEALIKELASGLSDEQKAKVILPWDHGVGADGKGTPTRQLMVNRPHLDRKIGECYSKPQQELVEKILRAICSGDEGYNQISRNGGFDSTGSFANAGAILFGNPAEGKYSMVFSSHHLTVRCDGNSEEGAAFGGPMYYGHSISGDNPRNVYHYQTKAVLGVLDMLDGKQREKAIITGSPGEQAPSVRFRKPGEAMPGIVSADLTRDQKALVEGAMRTILSPYRKEDADEVMEIVKANGGMDRIHLAFYQDKQMNDNQKWHFWRLEGPGFVWNYRVLPHVHTFVNISSKV